MALLAVEDLRAEFGGIIALVDLSFDVEEGHICALIGPNGAGKTTLFNCVSRLYQPKPGRITFDGRTCSRCRRPDRPASGSPARSRTSRCSRRSRSWRTCIVGAHSPRFDAAAAGVEALAILERLSLADLADRHAVGLPYGTLKRIEIARALAARPRLLMLDEPAAASRTPRSTSSATHATCATTSTSRCSSWSTTWRWSWRSPTSRRARLR